MNAACRQRTPRGEGCGGTWGHVGGGGLGAWNPAKQRPRFGRTIIALVAPWGCVAVCRPWAVCLCVGALGVPLERADVAPGRSPSKKEC